MQKHAESQEIKRLKLLIAGNKLPFAILLALESLPERKFASKHYLTKLLGIEDVKLETRIGQTFASLAQSGYLENHPLINYRMSDQACHDRRLAKLKFGLLKALGLVQLSWREAHLDTPDLLSEFRLSLPVEIKREIGWLDDVEHEGMDRLEEFVRTMVIPPVYAFGTGITQSVYRINQQGLKRLELFKLCAVAV